MNTWAAISKEEHKNYCWIASSNYEFARNTQIVEVLGSEIPFLLPYYPLGFFVEDGEYKLVALLSIDGRRNVFVDSENKWLCNVVPTGFRSFPFRLIKDAEKDHFVFCVNESYLTDEPVGNRIFDDSGELSTEVAEILRTLNLCENERSKTRLACNVLAEENLLTPWELTVTDKNQVENLRLEGLFKIDGEAFNALEPNKLENLQSCLAFPIVYGHMFSVIRTKEIGKRAEYIRQRDNEHEAKRRNLEGILSDQDSISFSGWDTS